MKRGLSLYISPVSWYRSADGVCDLVPLPELMWRASWFLAAIISCLGCLAFTTMDEERIEENWTVTNKGSVGMLILLKSTFSFTLTVANSNQSCAGNFSPPQLITIIFFCLTEVSLFIARGSLFQQCYYGNSRGVGVNPVWVSWWHCYSTRLVNQKLASLWRWQINRDWGGSGLLTQIRGMVIVSHERVFFHKNQAISRDNQA